MCDINTLNLLENKISNTKQILYDVQMLIKFGALASDSCVTDVDLQINKNNEDYYLLFRDLNKKIKLAIKNLDSIDLQTNLLV